MASVEYKVLEPNGLAYKHKKWNHGDEISIRDLSDDIYQHWVKTGVIGSTSSKKMQPAQNKKMKGAQTK